jgi:hypothetical protein
VVTALRAGGIDWGQHKGAHGKLKALVAGRAS